MKFSPLVFVALFWTLASSADVHKNGFDCGDEGCQVITCDADTCAVYWCSQGDCAEIGSYPNPVPSGSGGNSTGQQDPGAGSSQSHQWVSRIQGARPGLHCNLARCAVKTCNGQFKCFLVGFDSRESVVLGEFEDQDSLLDRIASDFMASEDGGSAKSSGPSDTR